MNRPAARDEGLRYRSPSSQEFGKQDIPLMAELKALIVPERTLYEEGWNAALDVAMEHIDAARAGEGLREAARNLVRLWFDIAGVGEKSYAAMHSGEGDEFTEAMWALRATLHPDTASPTPPTTIAPDGN